MPVSGRAERLERRLAESRDRAGLSKLVKTGELIKDRQLGHEPLHTIERTQLLAHHRPGRLSADVARRLPAR